jgi:hypothetical protein
MYLKMKLTSNLFGVLVSRFKAATIPCGQGGNRYKKAGLGGKRRGMICPARTYILFDPRRAGTVTPRSFSR